ncbi:hypothetical protein GCM10012280_02090 [Wenjunlia tyrosinilytica]|jgi:hypothetical protein|uniref:Uncharacterized protein n=1 Tax=Wenjunlia tyrosinilytica TaxID=1544741 RepID=A0A917ZBL1_9ACTN|nr:hypothetical protein GCM10012280_02090 [Wenjunlia tyrosinilytica]
MSVLYAALCVAAVLSLAATSDPHQSWAGAEGCPLLALRLPADPGPLVAGGRGVGQPALPVPPGGTLTR